MSPSDIATLVVLALTAIALAVGVAAFYRMTR